MGMCGYLGSFKNCMFSEFRAKISKSTFLEDVSPKQSQRSWDGQESPPKIPEKSTSYWHLTGSRHFSVWKAYLLAETCSERNLFDINKRVRELDDSFKHGLFVRHSLHYTDSAVRRPFIWQISPSSTILCEENRLPSAGDLKALQPVNQWIFCPAGGHVTGVPLPMRAPQAQDLTL